jgi:hypothetical protein
VTVCRSEAKDNAIFVPCCRSSPRFLFSQVEDATLWGGSCLPVEEAAKLRRTFLLSIDDYV